MPFFRLLEELVSSAANKAVVGFPVSFIMRVSIPSFLVDRAADTKCEFFIEVEGMSSADFFVRE